MTRKSRERLWPYAAGVLGPLAAWLLTKLSPSLLTTETFHELVGGVTTFASVLVGFLSTALAIFLALPEREEFRFMQQAGGTSMLVEHIVTDIQFWLVALVLSFGVDFARGTLQAQGWLWLTFLLWSYIPAAGFFALNRSTRLIGRFLLLGLKPKDDGPGSPLPAKP